MKRLALAFTVMAALVATAVLARAPSIPDAAAIQTAYEHELAQGAAKHDPGLRVRTAACNATGPTAYICSIEFTSAADRDDRLYLDIVQIDRGAAGWALKSGLCRS